MGPARHLPRGRGFVQSIVMDDGFGARTASQRGALSALLTSFDVMSTIWIMRS